MLEPPVNVVIQGDCLEVLRTLPDDSVDSVVTDPPAGIEFMGKDWDNPDTYKTAFTEDGMGKGFNLPTAPSRNPTCRNCKGERRRRLAQPEKACACASPDFGEADTRIKNRAAFIAFLTGIMAECLRVLKPGGHMLVWSIPRTSHWTATAIEDAGFEIRDSILHCFGQGFPKSLNIGKAVSKMRGVDTAKEQEIATYLRGQREILGLTRAQVDETVFGGTTRYAFVEGRNNEDGNFRIYLPTPEEWVRLKSVLKLDDRFDAYIQAAIPSRAERALVDGGKAELVGTEEGSFGYQQSGERWEKTQRVTKPATDEAKKWDGWGTQLKPAVETWWLARKPIEAQNVASQVLRTGTGAINIDGCRVKTEDNLNGGAYAEDAKDRHDGTENWRYKRGEAGEFKAPPGRWPSNLVLSHSPSCKRVGTQTVEAPTINRFTDGMKPFGEGAGHPYESSGGGTEERAVYECEETCPVRKLDEQSGHSVSVGGDKSGGSAFGQGSGWNAHENRVTEVVRQGDSGGASRFFANFEPDIDVPFIYTGKASKADKDADLDATFEEGISDPLAIHRGRRMDEPSRIDGKPPAVSRNTHPTVKSQALMTYLVRLVTPKGGIVLDPFAGSGSTLVAAITEGMRFIGIEREEEYHRIAVKRACVALGRAETEADQRATFDMMDEMEQE